MSLAALLRPSFPVPLIALGEEYFDSRRVHLDGVTAGHASTRVRGSTGASYTLDISTVNELGQLRFLFFCDCAYPAGERLCKHAWASIRELDRQGLAGAFLGDAGPGRPSADALPDALPGGPPARKTAEATMNPRPPAGPKSLSWRALLSRLDPRPIHRGPSPYPVPLEEEPRPIREIWYAINPTEVAADESLRVLFYQRERGKAGAFGKIKPLPLSGRTRREIIHAEDREIVDLLFGLGTMELEHWQMSYHNYGSPGISTARIEPAAYDRFLPLLCATGRFVLEEAGSLSLRTPVGAEPVQTLALTWDAGDPWELLLALVPHDTEAFRLETVLRRGEETLLPGEARPLPSLQLLLRGTTLARLHAHGQMPAGLPALLQKRGPCLVPRSQLDSFLESVCGLRKPPRIELPEEIGWREVSGVPRPRLRLSAQSEGRAMTARVAFDYGLRIVESQDEAQGLLDRDARVIRRRDREAESALERRLDEIGVPPERGRQLGYGERVLPFAKLPKIAGTLSAEGWTIETERGLVRHGGSWRGAVSSGIDWFDLDGVLAFGGATAGLPDILAAIAEQSAWVSLNDGTLGMIPNDWTERFALLAGLGERRDGKVRFRGSQGALLDALLAAEIGETTRDAAFQRLGEDLRGLEGVRPEDAPRAFRGELREYQKLGLGWLGFLRRFGFGGCLADDMGLGKTVQVLALLAGLPRNDGKNGRPSLVVAPRSLVYNWIEEAARFAPRLRACDHTGLGRVCSEESFAGCDLVVTTYGTMRRDILKLREIRFDTVILDEAQAIKNATSQSAKAGRLLKADHRLALTGTPVENHLGELWSIFEFLNPGMLGSSPAFKKLAGGNGAPGTAADADGLEVLARAVRPFLLRRTKDTVLFELPAKTEQTQFCELSARERRLYEELRVHYRNSLRRQVDEQGWNRSHIFVLEALLRLRQAACHPGLLDPKRADEPSAKLETLLEEIREVVAGGHKALVFSQFTTFLALVRKRLDAEGLVYEYLDGQTRDRAERVRRFQTDAACPLFLISLRAGGQGLNLTAADYVFILDPWWNPAVEAQAVDRAHRIGQTRRVFAYRLVARDTVEEKILEMQKSKRALSEAILSENEGMLRALTAEDLELLLG